MKDILERIKQKDPEQKEFHQAVGEVFRVGQAGAGP